MITPKVHLTLPENFGDEDDRGEDRHFAPIIPLLEGLIAVNVWHLRRSLRRAQKGLGYPLPPLYKSGVYYQEDPPGEENWKDIPAVLADGHGDCLPLDTLIVRGDAPPIFGDPLLPMIVPLSDIRPGDQIVSDGRWTIVTEAMRTGEKQILTFALSNGQALRCSAEHRLFRLVDGRLNEVQAGFVGVGDLLVTPDMTAIGQGNEALVPLLMERHAATPKVVKSISMTGVEMCGDLTTTSGKFWLPEADVLVHNCDRLVAWRVAELRVAGHQADPIIKWKTVPKDVMIGLGTPAHMIPPDGIQMVHVCVGLPGWQKYADRYEDNPLVEDPSKRLGMGGSYTSGI